MIPVCNATNREVLNDAGNVSFKCPQCLKSTIIRSMHARTLMIPYTCTECGFKGPN